MYKGQVFCDPATPRNRSLVRLTLNADMGRDAVERIAEVCKAIRPELSLDQWPCARKAERLAA